ncbi:DUF115 domain-containing protein [Shewanella maritima]|uniref:DUF115 domain-containing protein n=1 Tax=Shewanella maritima TaxID=2520507 RepID=A0A411PKH4_9GAMM|nr:6-hydroxymethylpterin diphosphokinase MptE-like protein [Shewanella maritima]QBF84015.1 DUF115 domain-containing protein [Shewanella maritima]
MQSSISEITNEFAISQYDEGYLTSVNRRTFEKIDSASLYSEMFAGEFTKTHQLHIVVGMDSGLLVNYLLNQTLADGSKYVFVELQDVLDLLNVEIPESHAKKVQVLSLAQFEQQVSQGAYSIFITKSKFSVHRSSAVKGNHLQSYSQLNAAVEKLVQHEFFEQTTHFNQKMFVKTQLRNLPDNLQPVSVLKDKFRGKTCVVLGGGPSLDLHLDWLLQNRDNLIVFAVSRLTGKLNKLGIQADIIVSVDPQPENFDVNKDLMQLTPNALLVYSYHLETRMVGQWSGAALYTGNRLPWSELDADNTLSMGPTVTNSAVEVAVDMGFEQIVLLGVDFCHSQSGATHTKGTFGSSLGPQLGQMFEWVETYSGEMAETPMQLVSAIAGLEESVASYSNVRVVNIAKDAAKVKGVDYQAPESIKIASIDQGLRDIVNPKHYKLSFEQRQPLLQALSNELIQTKTDFNKLIPLLDDARKLTEKMRTASEQDLVKLFAKLDKVEDKINSGFSTLGSVCKFYGYYEFSQFFSTQQNDERSQQDVIVSLVKYYKAFEIIAKDLLALVKDSLERVSLRIDEGAPNVDVEQLVEKWRKFDLIGRSTIWKQTFSERYQSLPAAQQELVDECEFDYQAHFTQLASPKAPDKAPFIDNAFHKLNLLNQNRHELGVSKMVQYTEPYIDTGEDIRRLHFLASSYLQVFQGKTQQALEAILNIPIEQMQELELKQAISLLLQFNRLDDAAKLLNLVCDFSDEYLPKYAKVLQLSGRYQEALNAYVSYLEKSPNSISVQLELSHFLYQLGEVNYALEYVEQVLKLEPENATALEYKKVMLQA